MVDETNLYLSLVLFFLYRIDKRAKNRWFLVIESEIFSISSSLYCTICEEKFEPLETRFEAYNCLEFDDLMRRSVVRPIFTCFPTKWQTREKIVQECGFSGWGVVICIVFSEEWGGFGKGMWWSFDGAFDSDV